MHMRLVDRACVHMAEEGGGMCGRSVCCGVVHESLQHRSSCCSGSLSSIQKTPGGGGRHTGGLGWGQQTEKKDLTSREQPARQHD